jgi:hypothetical protein
MKPDFSNDKVLPILCDSYNISSLVPRPTTFPVAQREVTKNGAGLGTRSMAEQKALASKVD